MINTPFTSHIYIQHIINKINLLFYNITIYFKLICKNVCTSMVDYIPNDGYFSFEIKFIVFHA